MKRRLWHLVGLREGNGGFGSRESFFFLALRGLSSSSSSPELQKAFFTGTIKVITSDWEKSNTQLGRSEFCSISFVTS